MTTARVFNNGRSQAVRIPREYRFDTDEVYINRIGDAIILTPQASLAEAFDLGLSMVSDDFLKDGLPESKASLREVL